MMNNANETKAKCRICLNHDKSDQGIFLYQKHIKGLRKYQQFKGDDLVKVCNCPASHKNCIFKMILVDQCMSCNLCGAQLQVFFISNDSLCMKLYHYKFMKTLIILVMLCLASIVGLIVNSQYEFAAGYYFWKVFLYIVLGLLVVSAALGIVRMMYRLRKEVYVSGVYFSEDELNKSSPFNRGKTSKKNLLVELVKDFTMNTVEKVDSKDKLQSIMGTLSCDFNLSRLEIIKLKTENYNMKLTLQRKDLSVILPQTEVDRNGLSIRKKDTLKESIGLKGIKHSDTLLKKKETLMLNPLTKKGTTLGRITNAKDDEKMLIIQEAVTPNQLSSTTGIDFGITPHKQDRIVSTNDLIDDRMNSEFSVLEKWGDNKELVLNISDDSVHNKKDRIFNMTHNDDSGFYLNSKANLIS